VAETATKLSPAPLQKHLLGGCTVDVPVEMPSAGHVIPLRCTLFALNHLPLIIDNLSLSLPAGLKPSELQAYRFLFLYSSFIHHKW